MFFTEAFLFPPVSTPGPQALAKPLLLTLFCFLKWTEKSFHKVHLRKTYSSQGPSRISAQPLSHIDSEPISWQCPGLEEPHSCTKTPFWEDFVSMELQGLTAILSPQLSRWWTPTWCSPSAASACLLLMWSWENSVFKTSSLPIFKSGHLSVTISICFCKCPVVFPTLKCGKQCLKNG